MHLIGNSSDEESFAEDDEEQNRTNRETVPANSTYSSRLVFKRRLLADSDSDSSPQRTAREDEQDAGGEYSDCGDTRNTLWNASQLTSQLSVLTSQLSPTEIRKTRRATQATGTVASNPSYYRSTTNQMR